MHKSATATELDKYSPDINQEPVTANNPQTLNRINAHREWRATPTSSTAQRTSNSARTATVPGHRINSHWSPFYQAAKWEWQFYVNKNGGRNKSDLVSLHSKMLPC